MSEKTNNIFKLLKFERKETIHSAMIATIIAHDENYWNSFFDLLEERGKEKGFKVKALRDSINFSDNETHKWIDTENVLVKLKNKKNTDWGRADIWIGTNKGENEPGDKYRLIIENKIDAGFQYRQLRGYFRYLHEKPREFAGLFVLCVKADEEFVKKAEVAAKHFDKESMWNEETQEVKTQYAIITYADIKDWLEKVIVNDTNDPKFNDIVKDYLSIVKLLCPKTL